MLILGYSVVLMFLLVLLLLVGLASRVHWGLKAAIIGAALLVVGVFYGTLGGQFGWPAEALPPAKFRFLAADIHEPQAYRNDPGVIYLWYRDIVGEPPPRAVRLPYSEQTRKAMRQATAEARTGQPVYMSMQSAAVTGRTGTGSPGGAGTGAAGGSGHGHAGSGSAGMVRFDFIPPPDTLPRKSS